MQSNKTFVLLVLGQSNASNFHGQRHASEYGRNIINFSNGKCYVAESPLLGATGYFGESWTLLANKLIKNGDADQVVIVPAAIGSSSIRRWQAGGDLNFMLLRVVKDLTKLYAVTHVLWHQGESDIFEKSIKEDYEFRFKSFVNSLRHEGVTAPVIISVATKCYLVDWNENNPVAIAQRRLPAVENGIYVGPDTDKLLNKLDRYDDCHYSGTGQEKFADAWLKSIRYTYVKTD